MVVNQSCSVVPGIGMPRRPRSKNETIQAKYKLQTASQINNRVGRRSSLPVFVFVFFFCFVFFFFGVGFMAVGKQLLGV